jgi:hypothetical protein
VTKWFQFPFLCFDPSLDPFPNAAIGAVLAKLFEPLNLNLDLGNFFRG